MRSANGKKVLDACCGGRMFWYDKHDERALFVDKRYVPPTRLKNRQTFSIVPDAVMDFRYLQYADSTFSLVVFDPPHLTRLGEGSYMRLKYGVLDEKTWKQDIKVGFSECFRVLKKGGVLVVKWNETRYPLKEVLKLTNHKPLFGDRGTKRGTKWTVFMK